MDGEKENKKKKEKFESSYLEQTKVIIQTKSLYQ